MPGIRQRALAERAACVVLFAGSLAGAAHAEAPPPDIVVTAQSSATPPPSTSASITAARIADTINAVNVEDTLKYLPSLVIRKRHIGDTQAPLATRTSGVGASARSLIYADGALLSALIGNNNTIASPRWGLVLPEEIARIDVLYGPFSAAYPGNSIGAVVNITTRLPDALEGSIGVGTNVQRFSQYGTNRTLPAGQFTATLGDRFGPLALFASASHVTSNSQPLAYVTLVRPARPGAGGTVATGAFDDVNRAGLPIAVIGAGGFERQRQGLYKLKAALDLTPSVRLTYVGGLFLNDTDSTAETYLRGSGGQPLYAGSLNIGGYTYTVAASSFSNNVNRYDERHWSHSLALAGTGDRLDWRVIGTSYSFARDVQRIPTTALPGALTGGAGTITRLDGTGWWTFDASGVWRSDAAAMHRVSFGYHHDRFELNSNRYVTSDWLAGGEGPLSLVSRGKTRTEALWAEDAVRLAAQLTLTLGGRYERWRAYDGFNFSLTPALSTVQPSRTADRFSPKASLAWTPAADWRATLSFGQAYRFPTVSELYQAVTSGPSIVSPDPNLAPERARSTELAIRRGDDARFVRLSLFNESIAGALLSQSAPVTRGSSTLFTFVQNVDRVRTRGVELAFDQHDVPVRGIDLSGSVTLVDARILADAAFPAAIGKRPPQIPKRKATIVATWRPDDRIALTAAARYSSRAFATIDNSDPAADTYQGFAGYLVVDLRANFKMDRHWSLAVGVDNVNDDRYFLFHPFPQRSFGAELTYRL